MNTEQTIEFTQIQIENIGKDLDKALAVSALLENDLGVQHDISSANAVCVIKELIWSAREMIKTVTENESINEK